jgi:hypothetical protein
MTDSTDRTAGIAGLTLTITAAKAGDASHTSLTPTSQQSVGNGWYDVVLSTTHTNTLGVMTFHITGTGADPSDVAVEIVSQLIDELATPTTVLTTQMTQSYAADGAAPTLAQALFLIQQMLGDFSISGTTLTVKKLDGTTTAATFTLDDGTNPTSITRAT